LSSTKEIFEGATMFSKPILASGAPLTVASAKMMSRAVIHTATVRLIFNGAEPVATSLGFAGTVQYTSYSDSPALIGSPETEGAGPSIRPADAHGLLFWMTALSGVTPTGRSRKAYQKVNRSEPCITRGARVETTVPNSAFTCCPFGWNRAAVLMVANCVWLNVLYASQRNEK
jgi:hypothetical protein